MSEKQLTDHWRNHVGDCNFFGQQDITAGEEPTLTIKYVSEEEVRNGQSNTTSTKVVIHWVEDAKPWILNVVNARQISKLYGNMIGGWSGKRLTLYVDPKIRFSGTTVGGIRVRPWVPKEPKVEKCQNCGQEIKPYGKFTVSDLVAMSKEKFGKVLCVQCAKAQKAGETE